MIYVAGCFDKNNKRVETNYNHDSRTETNIHLPSIFMNKKYFIHSAPEQKLNLLSNYGIRREKENTSICFHSDFSLSQTIL